MDLSRNVKQGVYLFLQSIVVERSKNPYFIVMECISFCAIALLAISWPLFTFAMPIQRMDNDIQYFSTVRAPKAQGQRKRAGKA
jgi:hypothetical protein